MIAIVEDKILITRRSQKWKTVVNVVEYVNKEEEVIETIGSWNQADIRRL